MVKIMKKKISSVVCFLFLIALMPINVIAAELEATEITHKEIMDNMGIWSKFKYNYVKMFGEGKAFSLLGEEHNCDTQPFAVLTYTVDNTLQQTVDCGGKSLIDLYNKDGYHFIKEVWSPHTFIHNIVGSQYIVECYRCPTEILTPETDDTTIPAEDVTIPVEDEVITGDKGLHLISIDALPAVSSDIEIEVEVKIKNDADLSQSGNVEVGIYADKVAKDWGLMSIIGVSEPIQTCGGEIFSTAKKITLSANTEDTFIFTVLTPNQESKLTDGTSNWDSSHSIVSGVYDECGAGYVTTLGKTGTSNGAWLIRNIVVSDIEEIEDIEEITKEERGIYIVKLETDYDAKEDQEVIYQVTFANDLDVSQTINAEVGIFADDIVEDWGMLSIIGSAEPIQSCEDEDFVSSKKITMAGNTKATYAFTIKVPNIESTLADGTSNWDSSHTVVAGLYDVCGEGYKTSNGKTGTSNGAWKIKNLEVEGGYNPQTIFFGFVGFLILLMIIGIFVTGKGKKK